MPPYERTLYRYEVALMHGTPEERFRLDSALVRFAPASEFLYCLGRDAIQAGHPSDALHVLESLDATYAWMKFMAPDPGFRVRALVQLARYERAIAAARQTHTTSPRDLTSIFPEIDALAALGRIDEIEGAVAQAVTRTDSLDPRLPNLMLYAGLRLEAAGRSQAARQLFARALNLYTQRPVSDQMVFGRGRSLYYLDRWDEARNAFAQLVQPSSVTTPYDFRAAMFLGSIAARQGDTSEVERMRERLHGLSVNPADSQYFEARVAAARGQPDRALVFLADAVKNGAQVWQLMEEGGALPSMEPDFAKLRGLPAFRKAVGFW
jgi:tetratricopeptide (TPR) repeat protein